MVVPAACLEVADEAEQVYGDLRNAATAARDFDARELQRILDQLQAAQPRVETLSTECRDSSADRLGDGTLVSPLPVTPTPAPTS